MAPYLATISGISSPGPIYNSRGADSYYYKNDPVWGLPKQVRNTLAVKAKYPYYFRSDDDVNFCVYYALTIRIFK